MSLITSLSVAFSPPPPAFPPFPPSDKRLMAWVGGDIEDPAQKARWGGMKAVVAQLQANPGLYTGVMSFCALHFSANGTLYVFNQTKYNQCVGLNPGGADLFAELKRQQMEHHPVVAFDDPYHAMANPTLYVEAFAARAKVEGWLGWNLDWEGSPSHQDNVSEVVEYFGLCNQARAALLPSRLLHEASRVPRTLACGGSHPALRCSAAGRWTARARINLLGRRPVRHARLALAPQLPARRAARRRSLQADHDGHVLL